MWRTVEILAYDEEIIFFYVCEYLPSTLNLF